MAKGTVIGGFVVERIGQRLGQAVIAQRRIQQGQVIEPDAFAAQGQGQAGFVHARLRHHQVDADRFQTALENRRPDLVEHRHRRHVERIDQGFAHRHLAMEDAVEILGLVIAETRRRVHQAGVGRDQASSKAKP
ncbi:MAG: hypothetical protein WDN06_03510 [Asticcacaulis sp.]